MIRIELYHFLLIAVFSAPRWGQISSFLLTDGISSHMLFSTIRPTTQKMHATSFSS